MGPRPIFSTEEARRLLRRKGADYTPQFLERLERKGWIRRIRRGKFVVIPLSSGEDRTPQLHEFLIAMQLVDPAAIAYWSALNHHGMTEQLPRAVYLATNHRVYRSHRQALGVSFQIVSVRPAKFFGIVQDWVNEQPFRITDREKTIIDGLDLPKYVGGVGEIAKAISGSWNRLNEAKLREYAGRIGNSAAAKRLGFLMETLNVGDPDALRKAAPPAAGFVPLDPALPRRGRYNRRWGLLVNAEVNR
jgi:predicted transcriptional regulator of viral defense system